MAIDLCKSGKTTAQHLKDLAAVSKTNEIHALRQRNERKLGMRDAKEFQKVLILRWSSQVQGGECPAYGKT